MDEKNKSVNDLQDRLEKTQVEGEKQQRLEALKSAIHLFNTNPDEKNHQSLKEQLEEALLHFDAEHHELVMVMQNTINSLSNSGV